MSNRRVTRTEASRTLTCIEASSQGFLFVSLCSGCDYYMKNHRINAIARKKPRSELSKYWQCTIPHNFGELTRSAEMKTPYQRIQPSKYNSYIVAARGRERNEVSSTKRVRLFSPLPTTDNLESSALSNHIQDVSDRAAPNATLERYIAESNFEKAIRERDQAIAERDQAKAEHDIAVAKYDEAAVELSKALEKYDDACGRQDTAVAERYKALCDRDKALEERDEVMNTYQRALNKISDLEKQLSASNNAKEEILQEMRKLKETNEKMNSIYFSLSEEQSSLRSRVQALETRRLGANNMQVPVDSPPLKTITLFASKLLPSVNAKKRLQSMFDIIYDNRKSFRRHVNNRIKGTLMDTVRRSCCKEIKNHFTGWKVLKALDCSTQSLNQECYKILYSIQKSFPKWAKVLPEIKQVQRTQYSLNNYLNDVIPINLENGRETASFDYRAFTDYLLLKHGLLDIIKDENTRDPVIVAVTFDGGSLSKFLSHVTGGYKLVDPRCKNPLTGELLFGESGSVKVQSHAHCFPIKIAIAKDSKELYRTEFADFFRFLKEYEQEHGHRVKFVFPQDMSSIWKTTGRGGTAKVKTFPCYCCSVTTATLVTPQPKEKCFRGDRCRQPKCFHHTMLTPATFESWAEQKIVLESEYPYLITPPADFGKSQAILTSIDELRDEGNPFDIAFRPRTVQQGREFDAFLSQELQYRMLPHIGTVSEKRQRLLAALEAEAIYSLMTKLVAATDYDSAFCEVEDAIPCIMHGGNRIGEKMFMLVLMEAWDNCVTKRDKENLIRLVEHYINTGIFGTMDSQSQWKLPVTKEFELETVSFSAWRVRKVLAKLGDLAERVLNEQDPDRVVRWQHMIAKYLEVMKLAFQHEEFADEDVELFQDAVDEWFYEYVELVGLPGITNYMHLLGAGHLYHYLKKWGNLYRYQQQGWEKKNGIIASFVNRRTRKGGAGGRYGPTHTSRVMPVMQWFQRNTAWATGDAILYFTNT